MKERRYIYYLFILIQSLVYGIGNPLTKVCYESITPMWSLATRFTLAFLIMLALFHRQVFESLKAVSPRVWVGSSLCCAAAFISGNIALALTTATNVGFIMSLPVLIAPLMATVWLKKKYDFGRLPVQLISIAGLFLLCCNGGVFAFGAGEFLALVEAVSLAGFLVFGESAMEKVGVSALTTLQTGLTALISIAAAFVFDDISVLSGVNSTSWLIIVYLAVFCTVVAYLMQNAAVKKLSSQAVSMLQCSQPILTAVCSFFMLGERLSAIGLCGAAIIVACLVCDSLIAAKTPSS